MKNRMYFVIALVLSFGCCCAADSAASQDAGWTPVFAKAGVMLIDVITPLLYALATWAVYKLGKKFGVDASVVSETQIKSIVKNGINYADRWAKTASEKPTSQDKMMKAIDFINTAMVEAGFKKRASEYISKLVEAQLEWDKKE